MNPKRLSALFSFVLLLAAGSAAVAQTCPAPPTTPADKAFPAPQAAFTHTAVADGNWNATTTWGGSVPVTGSIVCIPAGRKVTVTSQETSRLRHVQVNGELRMWIHSSTRLYVDTVYIASGATFVIGDSVNTVKQGMVAELVFISWDGNAINRTWDAKEKTRGFISDGTVRIYGRPKTHMVPMTANAMNGATSVTVDSVPSNWEANDKIVITGSYFRQVGTLTSSQDEKVTLGADVTSTSIGFSPALSNNHVRPRSDLRLHVANLTRNVVFRSEVPTSSALRGHVMLLNGDVDIRHAAFVDLGRTEKALPLDDFVVASVTNSLGQPDYSITAQANNLITNRRGRYAIHFHQNGTVPGAATPPSKVYNSVVEGTTSWAFVSHNSHVDFLNNVAYNFVGAGFVTESGSELGNFDNNIAIRGTGNGEYRPNRIVFGNASRPQPLADFGFGGEGFWFQGPAVRARNNVAAGCDGAGMIWFTTGQPDVEQLFMENGVSHDRYTHFPRSAVATVYAAFTDLASHLPRYWDHSDPVQKEKLVISDLPILEMDGLESYGNLVGFRLRFNNYNNIAWYTEGDFDFEDHIVPVIGTDKAAATRMRQKVKNVKAWNNETGLYPNYTMRTDWSDIALVNRLDYDSQNAYVGAFMDFQIQQTSFANLTIDGYEVAGQIETGGTNLRSQITFSGTKSYLKYANFDTWNSSYTCPLPTNVVYSSGTLSWTANSAHKRFLVRYRSNSAQQWTLVDTTGTSVALTGSPGTYQIMAGCKDLATGLETTVSTYTAAAAF